MSFSYIIIVSGLIQTNGRVDLTQVRQIQDISPTLSYVSRALSDNELLSNTLEIFYVCGALLALTYSLLITFGLKMPTRYNQCQQPAFN